MDDDFRRAALDYHRLPRPGKLAIEPTKRMATQRDLALAYSPGVAAACEAIVDDPDGSPRARCLPLPPADHRPGSVRPGGGARVAHRVLGRGRPRGVDRRLRRHGEELAGERVAAEHGVVPKRADAGTQQGRLRSGVQDSRRVVLHVEI